MKRILQKEFVPLMLLLLLMGCITWGARLAGIHGADQEHFVAPVKAVPSMGVAPVATSKPNLAVRLTGHCGVKTHAPENTLPSIRKAFELGYDSVELGIRFTANSLNLDFHAFKPRNKMRKHFPAKD